MKLKEAEAALEKLKEIKEKLEKNIWRKPPEDILNAVNDYNKITDIYYALEINITKFKQDNRLLGISITSESQQKNLANSILTFFTSQGFISQGYELSEETISKLKAIYKDRNEKFESYMQMINERILIDLPIEQNLIDAIKEILKDEPSIQSTDKD